MKKFRLDIEGINASPIRKAFMAIEEKLIDYDNNVEVNRNLKMSKTPFLILAILVIVAIYGVANFHDRIESLEFKNRTNSAYIDDLDYDVFMLYDKLGHVEDSVDILLPELAESDTGKQTIYVGVAISYQMYDEKYDWLEYGETVEYFHPEMHPVEFRFEYEGINYSYDMELDPPYYRYLMGLFPNYGIGVEAGFRVRAVVSGTEVIEIEQILRSDPVTIWRANDPAFTKPPRPLNELESWAIQYANQDKRGITTTELFDTLPECSAVPKEQWSYLTCSERYWSTPEYFARENALINYLKAENNGVFMFVLGGYDGKFRLVDGVSKVDLNEADDSGDFYFLPASGILEVQRGILEDWGGSKVTEWKPEYFLGIKPGDVLWLDNGLYIRSFGPADWNTDSYPLFAEQTLDWSQEKLLSNLDARG